MKKANNVQEFINFLFEENTCIIFTENLLINLAKSYKLNLIKKFKTIVLYGQIEIHSIYHLFINDKVIRLEFLERNFDFILTNKTFNNIIDNKFLMHNDIGKAAGVSYNNGKVVSKLYRNNNEYYENGPININFNEEQIDFHYQKLEFKISKIIKKSNIKEYFIFINNFNRPLNDIIKIFPFLLKYSFEDFMNDKISEQDKNILKMYFYN